VHSKLIASLVWKGKDFLVMVSALIAMITSAKRVLLIIQDIDFPNITTFLT
jgi:hypothetical protein